MSAITVSELRQNLAVYIARARSGESIAVTQHGRVVARIEPGADATEAARARLAELRRTATVGDVLAPTGMRWEAEGGELPVMRRRRRP
jgi:prevent-host-death family protein